MEQPKTFEEVWEETLCKYFQSAEKNAVKLAFTLGRSNGILYAHLITMNAFNKNIKTAEVADATF